LDDDDWILPGAFNHLRGLTQQTEARIYYGGYRFVDSNENLIEEWYPDESGNCFIRFMAGEWLPLQASIIDAQIFHSIGGFTPLEMLRGGDEDVDLTRRISSQHNIAGVKEPVAVIRIDREESTTNYSNLQEQSRQSRELILNQPDVFSRLRDSAQARSNNAGYWYGRILWIYLSSMIWNIQHRNVFATISRFVGLSYSGILSFKYWPSLKFWRGATRPHQANGWLISEQ
jgi:hypothetical protein